MRIVMIFHGDYPWDVRVNKMADSLVGAGHELHLVCRNTTRSPRSECMDGISIHRLPFIGPEFSRLNNWINAPYPVNPLWLHEIEKIIRRNGADAVLVRDLPLALAAILIAKLKSLPVIVDMAENWSEAFAWLHTHEKFKIKNFFLRNVTMAKILEKITFQRATYILLVCDEQKERLAAQQIPHRKMSVVMNTPSKKNLLTQRTKQGQLTQQFEKRFVILYVGYLTSDRGLDVAIKAMPLIKRKIPNASLVIVGKGKYAPNLRAIVYRLGLDNCVNFEGWVRPECVPDYINASKICILTSYVNEHHNATIQNKLFDYMALAKPVVVSDTKPNKRIISECNCGLVFRSGNIEEFAKAVVQLKDTEIRKMLGDNGRRAVKEKYNWEKDSTVLLEVFRKIEEATIVE